MDVIETHLNSAYSIYSDELETITNNFLRDVLFSLKPWLNNVPVRMSQAIIDLEESKQALFACASEVYQCGDD